MDGWESKEFLRVYYYEFGRFGFDTFHLYAKIIIIGSNSTVVKIRKAGDKVCKFLT